MSQDSNADRLITRELHNLSTAEKPTIRILLYTDDPELVVAQTGPPFGLGAMIEQIRSHPLAFANVLPVLESRYPNRTATPVKKINTLLKEAEDRNEPFDQVWFFGIHQINKANFRLRIGGGGPDSELDKAEIAALRTRMDSGLGVLVTGDHANRRPADALDNPDSPCPDRTRGEQYLGLGRALGRCIPRAGRMRDWEGDPTADPRRSFNTQVVTFGTSVTQRAFQQDHVPQQLILKTFNERGKPALAGRPHPLFFYRQGEAILLFPDHLHEGAVTVPEELEEDLWPMTADRFQPRPRVVAYGVDKRNAKKLKLIAAYDGDLAGAGRIVADSTWHHYFNTNLAAFPAISAPLTAADQIGQYYANLVLWLTPRAKRREMAEAMLLWIARQPEVAELVGPNPSRRMSDILVTGGLSMKHLTEVASDCEIHELLQMAIPRSTSRRYESLYFPGENRVLSPLPSMELLLGSLMHDAPQEPAEMLGMHAFSETRVTFRRNAIATASTIAFKRQKHRVEEIARRAKILFPDI